MVGRSSHSTRQGARWKNVSATEDYIQRVDAGQSPAAERRELTEEEEATVAKRLSGVAKRKSQAVAQPSPAPVLA